jgi:hypothetical protein
MEEFNLDSVLSAEDARHDKIQLDIGEWFISSIDIEMAGFIQYLGSDDRSTSRNKYRAFQVDNYVNDFTAKRLSILSPKSGRGELDNAPLFSGQLIIRKMPTSGNIDNYALKLKLQINPTRFCVYQPLPLRRRNENSIQRVPSNPSVLFAKQDCFSHANERTLDNKDNALLKPVSKINGSRELYQQNVRRYIESIKNYIDIEIADYNSLSLELMDYQERYSLKTIETYWDIRCDNPTLTIGSLRRDFLALGNNTSVSYYSDAGELTEGSSLALRAEFRTKERLKLYAKTNKRIRLEIEHKYNQNASLTENRSYTAGGVDELITMINYASHESTRLANNFLSSLSEYSNYPDILRESALIFIQILYRQIGNIVIAEDILSSLVSSGGIPTSNLNSDFKQVLDSLVTAGLVERKGRPINRYLISPRFASSVQGLIN